MLRVAKLLKMIPDAVSVLIILNEKSQIFSFLQNNHKCIVDLTAYELNQYLYIYLSFFFFFRKSNLNTFATPEQTGGNDLGSRNEHITFLSSPGWPNWPNFTSSDLNR